MMTRETVSWLVILALFITLYAASPVRAEDESAGSNGRIPAEPEQSPDSPETGKPEWHYGTHLDFAYITNFNFPDNHRWRSRTTTERANELTPNMGLVYVRKDATASSRWGAELGFQGGYDSKNFAFLTGEPKVDGADTLRRPETASR